MRGCRGRNLKGSREQYRNLLVKVGFLLGGGNTQLRYPEKKTTCKWGWGWGGSWVAEAWSL